VSLRRKLALALLVPAALVVVELIVGWNAARAADQQLPRLVLLGAAVLALLAIAWIVLGWSRQVSRPIVEAAETLRRTLEGDGPASAERDEVAGLRAEVTALLDRLASHQRADRRARAQLEHQRDLALAAARDGVVLLDDDGAVIAANVTARAVLGEDVLRPGRVLAAAELSEGTRETLLPLLQPEGDDGHDAGDASALDEIVHGAGGAVTIFRPERHEHGRLLVLRDVTDDHRFAGAQAAVRDLVLERRPVCLVTLLHATLDPLVIQARDQGVTLTLPPEGEPQLLAVDPVKLPWVITVIVGNALRYTGRMGEVAVELERDRDAVAITVRDTGAGMNPEQLDRVFNPPTTPDGRRPTPGTQGLALAIAREIVAAHGGRLEADSRPGIGTVVRLVLPLPEAS
jgi:signal transduction histidine kinase